MGDIGIRIVTITHICYGTNNKGVNIMISVLTIHLWPKAVAENKYMSMHGGLY